MSRRYMVFRVCCALLGAGLLCLVWFFSSQNGEESGRLSDAIARAVMRFFRISESPERLNRLAYVIRKAAHFNLFALLGVSFGFALSSVSKPLNAFWALPIGILSAIGDEIHQRFVSGRAGMWQDSLLDSCGVLTGAAAAYGLLQLISVIKRKKRGRQGGFVSNSQ